VFERDLGRASDGGCADYAACWEILDACCAGGVVWFYDEGVAGVGAGEGGADFAV